MTNRVLALCVALAAWIGIGLWMCNKYICNASSPTTSISKSTLAPAAAAIAPNLWTFADGSNFNHSTKERFAFGLSGLSWLNADNNDLSNTMSSLTTYLKANPERELNITGHYRDSETNSSLLPSLGHARAEVIKNELVKAGVSAKQLTIAGALLPDAKWATAERIIHGIDFGFAASSADARLTEIKNRLFGKPLTVYFKTNQKSIDFNSDQRNDLSDMKYYLENVATSSLSVGGHTDSAGGRRANINLSKNRAEFVAEYLTQNAGINSNRMSSEGFGPAKPAASNDTKEGMARNRRVEIILN